MNTNNNFIAIPPEETERYSRFVISVGRTVPNVFIEPERMLWHYTNGSALISILTSASLYSTHVSCLNDSTEIRYGAELFRSALKLLHPQINDALAVRFIERAIAFFDEDGAVPNNVGLPHFVFCLTELRDDLRQWRAYGGGENGYAIGFHAKSLVGIPNSLLHRVLYDRAVQEQLANEVAHATLRFYLEGFERFGAGDEELWTKSFLTVWDSFVTNLAPMIKHNGFMAERECRVTKGIVAEDWINLRFFQKSNFMSRHLVLQPGLAENDKDYRLPISEIVIGPSRHQHVSRISVATLLTQRGYKDVLVSTSTCPFQST